MNRVIYENLRNKLYSHYMVIDSYYSYSRSDRLYCTYSHSDLATIS